MSVAEAEGAGRVSAQFNDWVLMYHRGTMKDCTDHRCRLLTREQEASLFDRALEIAQGHSAVAENNCEANVFFLASTLIGSDFPVAAERLSRVSALYFQRHPANKASTVEMMQRGWIIGLPRFKDGLYRWLEGKPW